jgi:hypothetical protein
MGQSTGEAAEHTRTSQHAGGVMVVEAAARLVPVTERSLVSTR